jgi:hypothetical protein
MKRLWKRSKPEEVMLSSRSIFSPFEIEFEIDPGEDFQKDLTDLLWGVNRPPDTDQDKIKELEIQIEDLMAEREEMRERIRDLVQVIEEAGLA